MWQCLVGEDCVECFVGVVVGMCLCFCRVFVGLVEVVYDYWLVMKMGLQVGFGLVCGNDYYCVVFYYLWQVFE